MKLFAALLLTVIAMGSRCVIANDGELPRVERTDPIAQMISESPFAARECGTNNVSCGSDEKCCISGGLGYCCSKDESCDPLNSSCDDKD
jgi:hypothetical protein